MDNNCNLQSNNNYKLQFNITINQKKNLCNIQIDKSIYDILRSNHSVYMDKNSNTSNLVKLKDGFFCDNTKVKDEDRYYVKIKGGCIEKKESLNKSIERVELKKIILLLESPHKSEYRSRDIYDELIPIAPAQGEGKINTGGAISNFLDDAIQFINNKVNITNGEYILTISNPIQFQTSLAFIHGQPLQGNIKELRNNIWREIWKIQDIKNNFICRINEYNPELIINACTKQLKQDVTNVLTNKYCNKIVEINHPAYNWVKKNF